MCIRDSFHVLRHSFLKPSRRPAMRFLPDKTVRQFVFQHMGEFRGHARESLNRLSLIHIFNAGCFAVNITAHPASTCRIIFVLPSAEAGIINPSDEAMSRKPMTTNSRPMIITTCLLYTSRCV